VKVTIVLIIYSDSLTGRAARQYFALDWSERVDAEREGGSFPTSPAVAAQSLGFAVLNYPRTRMRHDLFPKPNGVAAQSLVVAVLNYPRTRMRHDLFPKPNGLAAQSLVVAVLNYPRGRGSDTTYSPSPTGLRPKA
jgi:hypothetical protein